MSEASIEKLNVRLQIDLAVLNRFEISVKEAKQRVRDIQSAIFTETWRFNHPIFQFFLHHVTLIEIALICLDYNDQSFCLEHKYCYPNEISGCFHCLIQGKIESVEWVCRGPLKRIGNKYSFSLHPTLYEDVRLMDDYRNLQVNYPTRVIRTFGIYCSTQYERYFKNVEGVDQFDPGCKLSFHITDSDFCQITVCPNTTGKITS